MNRTTRQAESMRVEERLHMAFELGAKEWKLAFGVEAGDKPRRRDVVAGDLSGLLLEIKRAKERFGLAESALVVSCYEAGREGFWLHRFLLLEGSTTGWWTPRASR
jgi:transposase